MLHRSKLFLPTMRVCLVVIGIFLQSNARAFVDQYATLSSGVKVTVKVVTVTVTEQTKRKVSAASERSTRSNDYLDNLLKLSNGNILNNSSLVRWLSTVRSLRNPTKHGLVDFYSNWSSTLPILSSDMEKSNIWNALQIPTAIKEMASTDAFLDIFWPFRFDIAKHNIQLALTAVNGPVDSKDYKTNFLRKLKEKMAIDFPTAENKIILSFNDPSMVDMLNKTLLVPYSKEFVQAGKHRFSDSERASIEAKTEKALMLINGTCPNLYKAMLQLLGCIAYYKSEAIEVNSGTAPRTLGLIWIDPSKNQWENEMDVPLLAEYIVHEFIHTALFYAEFFHGMYARYDLVPIIKTISAIRHTPRDFLRSFHAAYVSAGVMTFDARIGEMSWAKKYAMTLRSSIDELVEKSQQYDGLLTNSGKAMLKFLADYVKITRIPKKESKTHNGL